MFERHPLGSQSFVPLSGRPYLVAVAPAGDFDVSGVRVFRAAAGQGVHYAKGVWHHFLLVLTLVSLLFLRDDRAVEGRGGIVVDHAERHRKRPERHFDQHVRDAAVGDIVDDDARRLPVAIDDIDEGQIAAWMTQATAKPGFGKR